jgi:D5-like protein
MTNSVNLLSPDRAPPLAELCHDDAPICANNAGSHDAAEFIRAVFGPVTENPVWIQSLGNAGSDEQSRHVATRDTAVIADFVTQWDKAGRGMYFCVSTIDGAKRVKANAAEMVGLWADIDFKDTSDTPADILRKVKALRHPPSRIHATGNGYHCFWLFKEAFRLDEKDADDQGRIEAALKLLADLVCGDMAVTHCVALMRLPGTHNTKFGKSIEVTVELDTPVRYELDDLEDWLAEASPVILRKNRPAEVIDNNPFLIHAKALGFKPSMDVEKRLAGMSYMAGGDAAIHATQLAVSASLLTTGMITDDAVALILEATKGAAAGYGERWNWAKEEKAIRKMCADWLKKHPVASVTKLEPAHMKDLDRGPSATGQVVALAPRRAAKTAATGVPLHIILGGAVLAAIRDRGEDVLVTAGEVWRYQNGLWAEETNEQSWLNGEIEVGCRALELPSTIKLINESRQWILRNPEVRRGAIEWDSHGRVPTKSGLLDIHTLTLEPARPAHLATWRFECDYNSTAECPWWLVMLDDFSGDREAELRAATISTLQEVLGAALLENKSRELTRALILEGPSETGKTRVLDVLAGLFGKHPIATPLDALGTTHGLMEFRRRAPWVLHEAFNAGQWHMSSVVKSILTGDPVQINVKNGAITTQRIKAPVFWGTNHPPQFKEATKAIVNRLIVIKCRIVFNPKNLIGAAKEAHRQKFAGPSDLILETEMSGLLNWAVVGLRRALKRGYIATTLEMASTMEAVRQDSNIVAGFIEECVEFDPTAMISVQDFCAAFTVWWIQNKGDDRRVPSNESIGRAMSALGDNRLATDSAELRDMNRRYFGGINLNGIGLDFWQAASTEGLAKGKTARTSISRGDVNRRIPESWKDRQAVIRLHHLAADGSFGATVIVDGSTAVPYDSTPKF